MCFRVLPVIWFRCKVYFFRLFQYFSISSRDLPLVSGTNLQMNQMAGRVNPAYKKKVPEAWIDSSSTGLVRVIKKPVTIREKLPMEAASPLIRVGKISLMMTQVIGP